MPYSSPRPSGTVPPDSNKASTSTEGGPTRTAPITMSNARRNEASTSTEGGPTRTDPITMSNTRRNEASTSTEGGPTRTDPITMSNAQRNDALKEVKEILSTSPQLSTSPRRKSSPEALARRYSLKVELPYTNMRESSTVRRKNGDVVKPSLKRTKSEPTTPVVCPKYVHFGTDLEQIKFFLQFEKPKAVSAEVSDEESSDDDIDDYDYLPFSPSEDEVEECKLVISLPNFPRITTVQSQKEVFVDSVSLSEDGRQLTGLVQVANIAFHKTVTVRYTFDFWQSCSEISAKYSGKPMKRRNKNFDVFAFVVNLVDDKKNPIDKKTMLFAVRYTVDNREIWDNNSGSNYQVNFRRVLQDPYPPRRKSRRNTTGWRPPRRVDTDSVYRSPPSLASSPPSLTPSHHRAISSKGQYSITESLSAEMTKPPLTTLYTQERSQSTTTLRYPSTSLLYGSPTFSHSLDFSSLFPGQFVDGMPGTVDRFQPWGTEGKPIERSAPMAIPMGPSKPAIGSSSYFELVERYCFYHGSPCSTSPHALTGSPLITQ